jgi:hypothetical protein
METKDDVRQSASTRHSVAMLRSRAESLKAQAPTLIEPLATTYRRRARELELEAFLLENVAVTSEAA